MVLTRDSQAWLHIKIPRKLLETAAIQAAGPRILIHLAWGRSAGELFPGNSDVQPGLGTTAQYPPMSSLWDIATWTWPLHGVEASSCICSPVITTHIISQKGDLAVTPDVFLPLLLILNQQFHQLSHIRPSFSNPKSTGLPSFSLSPWLYTLLCSLRKYP